MTDEKRNEDDAKAEDEAASKATDEAASAADDAGDEEEAPASSEVEDAARPDVVARRVAALGDEEDPLEAKAREEERKLAERKAAARKGKKKKGGLETAASKKLAKIGERAEPRRAVAVASDADPLIERTAKIGEWAKKNQTAVQIVAALVAVGLLGFAGFLYFGHKRETEASVLLAKAVADERARVGDTKDDDESAGPAFKTYEARREAALAKYREVQSKYASTGAAILSRLAEGSLLLDKREPDGALSAFQDVKGSALAQADVEVRCRALEGIGFAYELKAQQNAGEAAKHQDDALKAYKELENTDVRGFKEAAMYHQARVLMDKGENDKAKETLLSLKTRLEKPDDALMQGIPVGPSFPYLRAMAFERLAELDPTAVPKAPKGGGGQMDPEALQRLMEQLKKGGGHP